jgi:hypothetical protein
MFDLLIPFLLLIPFFISFFLFYSKKHCWRSSFISASIVWGVLLTAITEGLNLYKLINFTWLFASWGVISIVITTICFHYHKPNKILTEIRQFIYSFITLIRINPFLFFSLLSFTIILIGTVFLAIIAPPNNWDSMTYHMSRVANWIQNQSVAHYPTHNLRQLDSSPWSEFAILNLQVLSGSDRFANLVQWSSMVGSLIGVTLIAKQLGANLIGQILSSLVCISIPMGLLQSVTTQNDYVVSFWLVCLAYNVLLVFNRQINLVVSLEFGASLGLAILSKSTAYIYAAPFCVIWLIYIIRLFSNNFLVIAIISFFPAILINLGHWTRNFLLFRTPLGMSGNITKNHLFTPVAIISNIIRNLSLHLPVAFQPINDLSERFITFLHNHILKIDINDSRTTFPNTTFQFPKSQTIFLHDDISGNLLHLILFLIIIGLYVRYRKIRNCKRTNYLIALLSTALLFNILLSWQPWGARLHLPFFVLSSAFIGTILSSVLSFSIIHYLLVFILTLSSIPYVFFSAARPLAHNKHFQTFSSSSIFDLSTLDRRFTNRPELKKAYVNATNAVLKNNCRDIGLYIGGDSWDYPLWVISHKKTPYEQVRFRSVNVENASKEIILNENEEFVPCAIFVVERPGVDTTIKLEHSQVIDKIVYKQVLKAKEIQVYLNTKD